MKYKAILNEDGYIEELQEDGDVEVNLEETRIHPLFCFKVVDNKAVYDEERYNYLIQKEKDKEELTHLHWQLSSDESPYGDWKNLEQIDTGRYSEEEMAEYRAEREKIRIRIRELENNVR